MKISGVRRALYTSAKALGDIQALDKAATRRSAAPVVDRARRRFLGRVLAKLIR